MKINLDSVDKVKNFVNTVSKFEEDIDLRSGRYIVDAKSIMGIFSLDLSKPIEVDIGYVNENRKIIEVLEKYA